MKRSMSCTFTVPDLVAQGKIDEAKILAEKCVRELRKVVQRFARFYGLDTFSQLLYDHDHMEYADQKFAKIERRLFLLALIATILMTICLVHTIFRGSPWYFTCIIAPLISAVCAVALEQAILHLFLEPRQYMFKAFTLASILDTVTIGKFGVVPIFTAYEIYTQCGRNELFNYLIMLAQTLVFFITNKKDDMYEVVSRIFDKYRIEIMAVSRNIYDRLVKGEMTINEYLDKLREALRIKPVLEELWKEVEIKIVTTVIMNEELKAMTR